MTWLLTALAWAKKMPLWLWATLGALMALFTAYRVGRSDGIDKTRHEQAERREENRREADEVVEENRRLSPDERRDKLRDWSR